MTRIQANAALLLAGALWGMGFIAQSTAMDAVPPILFTGLRFAAAALCVLPFALREGRRASHPLTRANWHAFIWVGIFLFTGSLFQQFGLLTTSVTNSGFLTGLYVVMTPILMVVLFRQFPHRVVWPAALAALAGIFLLAGGEFSRMTIGDWLTIAGAVMFSMQVIFIALTAGPTGRPLTLATTQFAVCAILGLVLGFKLEPISITGMRDALVEILYAGIISGGIGFTLQVVAQRYTTASQAAIFLSSEAVFAALFGAIFLGERVPAIGFVGCALILGAMLAVEVVPALGARRAARPTVEG